ncbi:MAG: heparinase II/III-family protein, partial [Candidatus Kapaibacterium sp.]
DSGRFMKLLPDKYYKFNDLINVNNNGDHRITKYFFKNLPDYLEKKSSKSPQHFPNFGLYIFNRKKYRLTVRCGPIGQLGKGGHAHNDQLSITLDIAGAPRIVDPGTYVYTSFPDLRNRYRSTSMHNTLAISGSEQNSWHSESKDDLFWMRNDRARAEAVQADDEGFVGRHYGFGTPHERSIAARSEKIYIIDECEISGEKSVFLHFHPDIEIEIISEKSAIAINGNQKIVINIGSGKLSKDNYNYSPSYGVKQPAQALIVKFAEPRLEWTIGIEGAKY